MPGPLVLLFLAVTAVTTAAEPPVHPFFDGDAVHEIRLTFESPNWYEKLRVNFEGQADPEYAETTLAWRDGKTLERAGVRFKGNSSYRSYPGQKKSFKIKTNAFVKGQRIDGLDTINLNNSFKDPSYLREKLYYELARASGLAAPRTNYAALYVNDEYWGLYFLTEDVDGQFLGHHIGEKEDGNLYKGEPRGTLQWRGPDVRFFKQEYEKANHEKQDDWSDLIEFVSALNNSPREGVRERLEALMDVESAVSLVALDMALANLDSYVGSGHNYYLYRRDSDRRFQFVPWDPNEAFGNFNLGLTVPDLQNLPLFWLQRPQPMPGGAPFPPIAVVPRPLAQRLWETPEFRLAYVKKMQWLIDGPLEPDALVERMQALQELAGPFVEREQRSMFSFD